MSILDYFKLKKNTTTTPTQILKEKAERSSNIEELKNNAKAIRLIYVALENFKRYGTNKTLTGITINKSSTFKLPEGMSIEEACSVISYLSKVVEIQPGIAPASSNSVAAVSHKLEDYGFVKLENSPFDIGYTHKTTEPTRNKRYFHIEQRDTLDLMTVGGDFNLFKNTDLYDRYFNWFNENITRQNVRDIYEKLDILVKELAIDYSQMTIDEM